MNDTRKDEKESSEEVMGDRLQKPSWIKSLLFRFFPQMMMRHMMKKLSIDPNRVEKLHTVFSDTDRVDIFPFSPKECGYRGFMIVLDQKTALYFWQPFFCIMPGFTIKSMEESSNILHKVGFSLEDIRFGTDAGTFERAVDLYKRGAVTNVKFHPLGYSARVKGGQLYRVMVPSKDFRRGDCNCYMGEQGYLCKHVVALALYLVKNGESITEEEREEVTQIPVASDIVRSVSKEEAKKWSKQLTQAGRSIKAYSGPSRTWFVYQDGLSEGCARLSAVISEIPIAPETAELLVKYLIRLDDRLCRGGIDDSDGTVGGFIEGVVEVLQEFARKDPRCVEHFERLCHISSCFDWEMPLVSLYDKRKE